MGTDAGIPFGNYTLLKRIARGGMAEVFVARQEGMDGFDRMVAIKRILPHLLDDKSFVRMFQDEARLAARLSHPNVIHIYDFGKVDEHFFIAMELMHAVHAGDLIRLAGKTKMPATLVARIGANACAGLHYAHHRKDNLGNPLKLVHRDVSPPNLLISYDGIVKLVDFGIAKAVSSIEQTRPGVVKGKYAFMSPEQTMGHSLDGHSDVFSLALVLWEMLAGTNAVVRDNQILAMQTIRDGKVPAIGTVRKDVPTKLANALRNALRKSPDKRSDARQFGKELEAFIKGSNEIATNMELGAWLTEHLPPKPVMLTDESAQGTKRATVATSLQPLVDEGPEEIAFSAPAGEEDDGAVVTKLIPIGVADLPSVKGNLTQDDRPQTPKPEENGDSVVIARDLISQQAREVGQPTPTTAVHPSASNEDSLDDPSADEETSEHTSVDDEPPVLEETNDAPTKVGHGFATSAAGMDEMDEPTNDMAGPTEVDATEEDPTVEDFRAVGAAARAAVESHDSLPPSTGKLLAHPRIEPLGAPKSAIAKVAPWAAGGAAIIVLLLIATMGDSQEKAEPEAKPVEEQPIVFDPNEAAAYHRDGSTGLPPIVVTPLPDSEVVPTPTPEGAPPELAPPEVVVPKGDSKSRHRREKSAKNMGHLAVKTSPSSDIYYHQNKLGSTPLSALALKKGRYRLKFVVKGGASVTKDVVIRAGKVTKLDFAIGR